MVSGSMSIQAVLAGGESGLPRCNRGIAWRPLLVFALFASAVVLTGSLVFQRYRDSIKNDSQNNLSAIAFLKIGQITAWISERKSDAQALRQDPLLLSEVEQWLQRGGPDGAGKKMLTARLEALQQVTGDYHYNAVSLFDSQARLRLTSNAEQAGFGGDEMLLIQDSLSSGQAMFSDLHREQHHNNESIEIDLAVPLGRNGRNIGALLFHIDPGRFLFPLIQQWPTPSVSAESLLVRREGDQVVYLNNLRHRKGTALSMRLPITQLSLPASMAALGQEGLVEGLDYRGVPVVAMLHKVPGTSWTMISKIDEAEIYAPVDKLAAWVTLLTLVLIGAAGGAAIIWWKQQQRYLADLQGRYASEEEKRLLGEAINQAGSAIGLADRDNHFLYINPSFTRLFGYTLDEVLGKPVNELIGIEGETSIQPRETSAFARQSGLFQGETLRRTKDGRIVPVSLSVSAVRNEQGQITNYIASFADLTRYKQAEAALEKQKDFIRQIIDSDPNLIFAKDKEGRFLFANEVMAKSYGQTTESMVGKSNRDLVGNPQLVTAYDQANREVMTTRQELEAIESAEFPDGSKHWLRTIRKPLVQEDGSLGVLTIATDITELKEAGERQLRLNRALRLLGACNAAVAHAEAEPQLMAEACKLVVETGGYRMAWIGWAEHDQKRSVRPVAYYGFEDGYLEEANISWADTERGHGPTGTAIRTGQTQFNQSFLGNPKMYPWREAALARGYQSSIALPLECEKCTCGALTIYSAEADAFNADEIELLEELGRNLAFGIATLRARSERSQAVERLRQSEEHFRFLTERSTDMVYLMSVPNGRYEYVSPVSTQLFGYTPEEFCNSPMLIHRVIHPDWREDFETQWERMLAGDVPPEYEYQIVHRSGEIRWVSQRSSPIRSGDGSGALIAVLGVVADVTRRKQAEALLEEQRIQLRTLVQTIPDLVWLKNTEGAYLSCNPQIERLMGASEAEIVGKTDYDFFDEEIAEFFRQKDREAMTADKPCINEEWVTYPDTGQRVLLETIKTQVRDESGRVVGVMGIARDISERKNAEDALQRQKDFMAQVLDTDPNLIFVKNAEGRFIWANQAMAEACGTTVQEMIWKHNSELYPDLAPEVANFLTTDLEVIRGRREVIVTESARLPDGRQRWYLTIKRPLVEQDGTVNVLGIAVDITEQRQSEKMLADSYKELQRLSAHLENVREDERTRIARELHDEMGATLAAMKMRVAWMSSKLPADRQELSEEAGHISELVSDGIRTVREIVYKLRPSSLEDVGLAAAIEDCVKKFRQHSGIECTLSMPESEFTLEPGRAALLFRIVQESLSNVAKHAQASHASVLLTKGRRSLTLVVEDNGNGFEQKHKEKSFGLLGIRERALMLGGRARIVSTPGQGTRITVNIPDAVLLPDSLEDA